jgi:Ca2+-binding RTX toxin-like protein
VFLEEGNDSISGLSNSGSVFSGEGNDSISGLSNNGSVFLGEGEDYIKVLVVIFMAETVMTH